MQFDVKHCFCLVVATASLIDFIDGACTYPTELQGGTWHSSDMGDVTFNSTHFIASMVVDFGKLTFECMENTGDRYYSLSAGFSYLGISKPFKVAVCFMLTKSSSTEYLYYPQTSVLGNTDVNRIVFNQATHTFTATETCNEPSTDIYHTRVLVKEGFSNVTKEDCMNAILGIYSYNVSGSSCTDTRMDVCTEETEVRFNYTYCSDIMAYSAGGVLNCVHNSVYDGKSFALLYNIDSSVDESTYYRFTCLAVSTDTGSTYVTQYPRACLSDQNSTEIASPGVAFVMSANSTCVPTTTTTTTTTTEASSATFSAGAAVAIVIALIIILAAAVVIGIWYYCKVHKQKKVNPDMIASKSPPIDTKEQERNLDGRVSPFSPYPTVSEIALYRFGPSEIDDDDGGMTLEATTPGFTDGRRTMYGKDVERESQASLPVYSEVGGETPEPTRLSEVHTRMSEISEMTEVNIADPTPFTMTRATMNIPAETRVSPLQTPNERPNGTVQSPRDNGETNEVTI